MTTLTVLVGLSGSGKSKYAKELALEIKEQTGKLVTVVESDEYRERFQVPQGIKEENRKLFEIIHKDIIKLLQAGASIIFDATNLTRKYREPFIKNVRKNVANVQINCVLVATQYEICLVQNNMRERKVPDNVIKRMRESFNVPMYQEDFDKIDILFNYKPEEYTLVKAFERMDSFDQENPHHSLTLGMHCRKVNGLIHEQTDDDTLSTAGLFHDVGKLYTKVFRNMKGEPSEMAHYYCHEMVGSYESLFYFDYHGYDKNDALDMSALILHHMRPYFVKTEKSYKKIVNQVGEGFYKRLLVLHEADKEAH